MKSYLKNKLRQKEKNLREINDLQRILNNLKDNCINENKYVSEVTYGIQSGLKGDNTGKLASLSDNINKNNNGKINESISLASTAKAKIEDEIKSIERQLREIAVKEDEERRKIYEEWRSHK